MILCIYKIAAVSATVMISLPLKAPRWPQIVFLNACVTATESQETATCLIRQKAENVSEQRRWHFTARNTCTFSSTGTYSYITFLPHQSRCACARACARLTYWDFVNYSSLFKSTCMNCTYSLCLFYAFCIHWRSSPLKSGLCLTLPAHICKLRETLTAMLAMNRTKKRGIDTRVQLSKNQQTFQSRCKHRAEYNVGAFLSTSIFFFSVSSPTNAIIVNKSRRECGNRALCFLTTHHPGRGRTWMWM